MRDSHWHACATVLWFAFILLPHMLSLQLMRAFKKNAYVSVWQHAFVDFAHTNIFSQMRDFERNAYVCVLQYAFVDFTHTYIFSRIGVFLLFGCVLIYTYVLCFLAQTPLFSRLRILSPACTYLKIAVAWSNTRMSCAMLRMHHCECSANVVFQKLAPSFHAYMRVFVL